MIDFTGKTDRQIVEIILKNHTMLVNTKRDFEGLWDVETKIFLPRRLDMLRESIKHRKKGKQYGSRVYDGHPANAANKYSLGMLAHIMSRVMPWIQFVSSDIRLMKDDNVKKYVQGAAEQVLFGLNESDLYGQSVWFAKDATVIGTAVNIPEHDKTKGRMHYETVHPGDSYIKRDRFGNLITYQRPVRMTAIDAFAEFEEAKLPASLIQNAKVEGGGNPFKEYEFLYAVYKNPNPRENSLRSEDKAFKVFYILLSGERGGKKKELVFKGGTQFEPNTWAYGAEPGCDYGTSIAADALTEGLQANKLGELILMMVHRESDMPLEAPRGMRGDIQTNPGGRTYVPEKYAGKNTIKELFQRGNWPISDAQAQRLHDTIDDKFFVPLWDALMTLEGPAMTATQVLQIQGNKAVLLSPVTESFEDQYLKKVVNNQWIFEEQIARRMPDVPDILLEPANRKIETVFIGPLFQLQRATMQTRGTINALAVIGEIGAMWPESLLKINEMELIEDAAIAQGMKQSLIKSDEEVQAILEAKAALAQEQAAAEVAIEAAKAAPAVGKAIEPNSPLELAGVGS